MKKLAIVLAASTAIVTAASANTGMTGFYVGLNAGGANTAGKTTVTGANGRDQQTLDSGKWGGIFGLYAGYGMAYGQAYFGGEILGNLDNTSVNIFNLNSPTAGIVSTTKLKRSGSYGLAVRLGYMANPCTLAYVRLGGEVSNVKLTTTNAAGSVVDKKSSNKFEFVPGVGIEVLVLKNVALRAEYTYRFASKLQIARSTNAVAFAPGDVIKVTPNQQTFKVGVAYKF